MSPADVQKHGSEKRKYLLGQGERLLHVGNGIARRHDGPAQQILLKQFRAQQQFPEKYDDVQTDDSQRYERKLAPGNVITYRNHNLLSTLVDCLLNELPNSSGGHRTGLTRDFASVFEDGKGGNGADAMLPG